MDSNRLRYKQVGSKFRSSDDSRAIRAINQEDGRRAKRSHVLHIHRNIPETLSPEPSPSVMGVRPTKKALAAAAAIAKAKATIHKLAADDAECDMQIASHLVAAHHQNKENASPVVKNSPRMRNTPSTTKTKATKPAKLIGGKTLEELRNERMERLKLYKQRKQRMQEREKAAKKPNFWLGVAKRDPKVLLLPSHPEPKGPRKLATPSKVQTPIWHSGFSVSKKQAPGGPTPFSTNKNRALKSSRNIFTNATPGVSTSSRAASTRLASAAGKPAAGRAGHERVRANKNASFAPKDYKFLAPSGLQQVPAREPTPRRPSIRFSGTPPSITPPTSGPRRMPRTKTPRPATRTPARPSSSSASTESSSSSSSDELPVNNLSGTSHGQETSPQKTSLSEVFEPSYSGSPMSPETESAKAKLAKRPSKKRASRSSRSNEIHEALMSDGSSERASHSREMAIEDENLERSSDVENVSEGQHSFKQSVRETNEELHSSSEEKQKFSDLEVDNEEIISVTPPNTEFSFAVLADSIKKRSRERSISKVSRSASIKKSNLISKLNLSANESDESSLKSSIVKTNMSFETKSPFAQKTSSAENQPNLPKQHHSSSSSLSDENELHLSSNKTLVSASSSNCLSPSPISSLVDIRTASRPNSSQKSQDRRPSAHKLSSGERSSVDASARLTVPASDECGCSPDLQPRSKKRKSVMKILAPANAGAGDATSSGAADCDPPTPAASTQPRRSMSVRRSVRLASVASNAGDSDGGLRTPSHASQRTTATTPCSRSTRRSLAVHAASTWEEFCAVTPQLPAPAKTPRRRRKTMADSDDVPPVENLSPQSDEHHFISKTPGRKGRRKTIADSDNVRPIEENLSPHSEHHVTSKTPGRKGRRKTIAAHAHSDVAPNGILSSQSERKATSKTPGRKGRRKTVISETQNDFPEPGDAGKYLIPQLDREVSGTEDATAAAADVEQDRRTSLRDKVNGMHGISPDVDNQEKKRAQTPDCITPADASTSAVHKFSERTRRIISVTPAFSTQSASSGASLSPGSSQLDVSQLPDESPFVNMESRARKRKKLAHKRSSFMDGVHEDVLQSLQRDEEVRDDENAITPPVEDSTNPELAELLRPTTPCSPADSSINVWDEMSPMVDNDGGAEAKENEEPGRESKRRSIKYKRRSSLREGALLGALKARNESVPNSRPSLGLFAKGAPQSPVVIPASIAEGEDLISWESPKSAQQMHDGDVDQLTTESPKIRSGSVRGRRVSRLAALYEQTALSPAPSPASPRRSTRLSHFTPLV